MGDFDEEQDISVTSVPVTSVLAFQFLLEMLELLLLLFAELS